MKRLAGVFLALAVLVGLAFPASAQSKNVGDLSVLGAPATATFKLLTNPGNYFSVVGTEIVASPSTPTGHYSVAVQATGGGLAAPVKKTFVLNFVGAPAGTFFIGFNFSGLENVPPTPPNAAQVGYFVGLGFTTHRLPINWVNIQPTAFGALDPTFVATLHSTLNIFSGLNAKAVIDIHNFGSGPGGFAVGSAQLPIAAFVDLWNKIIAEFGTDPGLYGIDLMNEWVNGFSSITAQAAQQQVITSVRGAGYSGWIYAEGVNFTGAWNWVSGLGQPFNNVGMVFNDPLRKTKIEAHTYLDFNNSGGNFSYAVQAATPGVSPPGSNTSPTIGVTRLTPWINWLAQNGQVGNIGEMGASSDAYAYGGNLNYPAWNLPLDNSIALAKANNVEFWYWGAGSGFGAGFLSASPGYGFNPEPFSATDLVSKDYSATGVQAPQMVVLRRYASSTAAQPTAYALALPMSVTPTADPEKPTVSPVQYSSVGVPSAPFKVYYGGKITSPVTITPHDTVFATGASASGTFTPASAVLQPGENALASFTYTATQATTLKISTTNDAGWTNPPALGFSSVADTYSSVDYSKLTNDYPLYNDFTPNIAPALTLQRVTDNQQMNWSFTLPDNNGTLSLDRTAIQTWASARSGIRVVKRWDISGKNNHMTFTGQLPTLNLNNAAGYPEFVVVGGETGTFNTPLAMQTLQTVDARINQASSVSAGLFRLDWFVGPIVFNFSTFDLNGTDFNGGTNFVPNINVSLGITTGSYHDYTVTYTSGAALASFVDGTAHASTSVIPYAFNPWFNRGDAEVYYFNQGGSWKGQDQKITTFEGLALSPTQVGMFHTALANYYSTALPDTLPAVPPTIVNGGIANNAFIGVPNGPFSNVSVLDENSGSPTDALTITLSGAAATLTGSGITGTNPYNIAAASASSVTATLKALALNTSASSGSVINITIAAVSSAGSSSSTTMPVTVTTYGIETAFTPPIGTFTPVSYKGVNMVGAENHPATVYPVPFFQYKVDYYISKGFGAIRLQINSQNVYPTAFGALDTAALTSIKAMADYCFQHNVRLIIDLHDFGNVWNSQTNSSAPVLPGTVGQNLFNDFWSRLGSRFSLYANVVIGQMNEPVPAGGTVTSWQQSAAQNVLAIRAAGANNLILLAGGVTFDNAGSWVTSGNGAAWHAYNGDPQNNFMFEMHQYLNGPNDGQTATCSQNGSTVLADATAWLVTEGRKSLLTEFGFSPATWQSFGDSLNWDNSASPFSTNCITDGGSQMSYMTAHATQWPGWTFFTGGAIFGGNPPTQNSNAFDIDPTVNGSNNGFVVPIVDQPQMAVLVGNL